MTDGYIHGGSDAREVARLERQAAFFAPLTLEHFDARPGMHVLDLGTGVGAMAEQLTRRFPGIQLTGLDLSASQLAHARTRHPVATYVQGDAARMPFADGTFDRVHASWVLEHVKDPLAVLREVRRVLKRGGICQFIEVDNRSLVLRPEVPNARACFEALGRAQREAGGDPEVGQRLGALLKQAGFTEVRTPGLPLVGSAENPRFFANLVEEFTGILASLDEALGPEYQERIRLAVDEALSLLTHPDGELHYTAILGRGLSP